MNDRVDDLPALRAAYSRFLASGRVLLTGHSHQAWPDAARDALIASFDDAARLVDDKWAEVVFPKAKAVGEQILARMGLDPRDPIAFGRSTHELVFRLLSCLPIFKGGGTPRIVTTTTEFHSLRRQLTRLAEEGIEIVWVDGAPRDTLAGRLLAALSPGTSMLAVSGVFFDDAFILPRLPEITARATELGALVVVDAYHAFNVAPLAWGPVRDQLFVTSGGYKYAGFGEGLCWLRLPPATTLRPVYTGWFTEFGKVVSVGESRPAAAQAPAVAGGSDGVSYGEGGARFAGATFDGTAFYRAEAALATWDRFGLTAERLRAISTRQTRRILDGLDAAGLERAVLSPRDDARRGGFVTVRARGADAVVRRLRKEGVLIDARGETLRVGPAPYLTDEEIDRGVSAIARAIAES